MTDDVVLVELSVLDEMAETVGDDVTALVVQTYLASAGLRLAALRDALPEGGRALRDAAHAMTAASATVGARHMSDLLWEVEARAGDGRDDEARRTALVAVDEMPRVLGLLAATRWAAPVG